MSNQKVIDKGIKLCQLIDYARHRSRIPGARRVWRCNLTLQQPAWYGSFPPTQDWSLPTFEPRVDPAERPLPPDRKRNRTGNKRRKKNGHPNPRFDLRTEAYQLFGVDVTQIPGLEENVLPLFSEAG